MSSLHANPKIEEQAKPLAEGASWKLGLVALLIGLPLVASLVVELDRIPTLWWDEGWTMMAARNWVGLGHYGQIMDGQLQSPGLAAHFPVIAAVALSFKLFGEGVWQARLPSVIFTLGALAALFFLANQLFGLKNAWITVFILVFATNAYAIHPVVIGRQVMGEPLTLFALTLGYIFLFKALKSSFWWLILAALFWGIALQAKAQVSPFWLASMFVAGFIALYRRWWNSLIRLIAGAGLTLLMAYVLMPLFQTLLLEDRTVPAKSIAGAFNTLVWVTKPEIHLGALQFVCVSAFLPFLGILWVGWRSLVGLKKDAVHAEELLRWSLLGLTGAWFAWYLILSIGWTRHLFLACSVACIFSAAFLSDLTDGFRFNAFIKRLGRLVLPWRQGQVSWSELLRTSGLLGVLFILVFNVLLCIFMLHNTFLKSEPVFVSVVADYLNEHTPPNTLIETYESELMLYLDRRYHYPPDQTHIVLVRHDLLDPATPIDYDPLAADPDYLVLGRFNDEYNFYDLWIESGHFRQISQFWWYRIYERVR